MNLLAHSRGPTWLRRGRSSGRRTNWLVEPLEPRTLLHGTPTAPEFRVNSTTAGTQLTNSTHTVASNAAGDFVAVWENLALEMVFGQRYGADGAKRGAEFPISPPWMNDITGLDVAMDAAGNFVVVWGNRNAPFQGMYSQRYDANGVALGSNLQIRNDAMSASVAMDPDGDYVVTWDALTGFFIDLHFDVFAVRFDATGVQQGGAFPVIAGNGEHTNPQVATDAAGNFVIAWTWEDFNQTPNPRRLQARLYDSQGTPRGSEFDVTTTDTRRIFPDLAMDGVGNFTVVWNVTANSSVPTDVRALRFSPTGVPIGLPFIVNAGAPGAIGPPGITMDPAGDAVVTWRGASQLYGQAFRASGAPDGAAFRLDTSFLPGQLSGFLSAAMDYDGDFVAAWNSSTPTTPGDIDVYARQFSQPHPGRNTVTGQVFNDLNGNGATDGGEPGLAGWRVYRDANGNGQFDTQSYVNPSTLVQEPLPTTSTRSYLGPGPFPAIAAGNIITDVNVTISIGHPFDGDLTATLVSPGGRRAELFRNVGGAGQNFTSTTFDDNAATAIDSGTAPFTGTYRTQNVTLGVFNSERLSGDGYWMLEVRNDGGYAGSVYNWLLTVTYAEDFAFADAAGNYSLSVPPGQSQVGESLASGWAQTFPPSNGQTSVNFGDNGGQTIGGVNFGNTRLDIMQGRAFQDVNADGTRDAVDPGMPGVRVYTDTNNNGVLDSSSGTHASADVPKAIPGFSTLTSDLSVSGLPPAIQEVFVTLDISFKTDQDLEAWLISPSGFTQVLLFSGVGYSDANFTGTTLRDSAATPIFQGSAPFTGTFRPQGSLADLNGQDPNGTWQLQVRANTIAFPPGSLNSWSLGITSAERSAVTDATGNYLFTGITPGTYVIRQEPPSGGWQQTLPASGAPYTVNHAAGQIHRDLDFGNAYPGTVSGGVFNDINANGVNEAGEALLGGWTVFADLNNNGQLDSAEPSTVSHAPLGYQLRGVPLNRSVALAAFPLPTIGTQWEFSAAPAPLTLTPAQPGASLQNFGAFRRGSISGIKFNDLNGNGAREPGEPGLPGWTIFLDQNGNGQLDGGPVTTRSRDTPVDISSAGRQVTSHVSVQGQVGPVMDVNVTLNLSHPDLSGLVVVLISPLGNRVQLFGDLPRGSADFTGTTFDDQTETNIIDGTAPYEGSFRPLEPLGTFDGEDPNGTWTLQVSNTSRLPGTLDNWSLTITTPFEPSTVTDAAGRYAFTGLRPGAFAVREQSQPGWSQTAPAGGFYAVTLTSGQDVTDYDFGDRLTPIAPTVTHVYAGGTSWSAAFSDYLAGQVPGGAPYGISIGTGAGQLAVLPWTNLNRISITFSGDVQVDQSDLSVRGVNVASYPAASFNYNPADHTATWTFSQSFAKDKLLLDLDGDAGTGGVRGAGAGGLLLDGEWATGSAFPSGDGTAGGDFRFRLNILPGDVDRSGSVLAADFSAVKARFFKSTTTPGSGATAYTVFHDVDGSGSILANDFSAVKTRFFQTLPGAEPLAAAAPNGLAVPFGTYPIRPPFRSSLSTEFLD